LSDHLALVFYTGVIRPPSLLFTRQLDLDGASI